VTDLRFTEVTVDGSQALVVDSEETHTSSHSVVNFGGPLSSATGAPIIDDDSDDDLRMRPKRLNVAEKRALSVDTQVCTSVYPNRIRY